MIACQIVLGQAGKHELSIGSPLLVAAGALGFGDGPRDTFSLEHVGAVVLPPMTRQPLLPPAGGLSVGPGRVARVPAGCLLHTGRANPGVRTAVRRYARSWARWNLPVIAALYMPLEADLPAIAAALAGAECVLGIELHLPHDATPEQAQSLVVAVRAELGLPCLVRLPFARAVEIGLAAERAGADALVVADPPLGRARGERGEWVVGPLHSPALGPLYVQLVHELAQMATVPLIGRGGVADVHDVLALVAAGAVAVELDSVLWRDPTAAETIYAALEARMRAQQADDWHAWAESLRRPAERSPGR